MIKEEKEFHDYQLEMENRIRNLLWTISGDYSLDMKPDISLYLRSKSLALYDGVKQGAFARYYEKEPMAMYLVKKIYAGAGEREITILAQLCIEEAIGQKICQERPGIATMQRQACADILDQEFEVLPSGNDILGRLRIAVFRDRLSGGKHRVEASLKKVRDEVYQAREAEDTMDLIRLIDKLYNKIVDPDFERCHGDLEYVLGITLAELTEFGWEDFLTEDMYEEALEAYVEKITNRMTDLEDESVTKKLEDNRRVRQKITVLSPEMLEKAHTYVELNFGKSYLSEMEEKQMNYRMCTGIHADCSLYFTEGILKNPVKRNYQYEYAKRLKNKNIWTYHDKHRIAKRNISVLTELLKKALILRSETEEILSDRGKILPARLWRIGRSADTCVFKRELKAEQTDFVVDVLIDASGSQMSRQGDVALQAYIISEALSCVEIPHRVMSYCTFWDYTVLHRFREYDDPRSENENIFNYVTSSNNRDGLAIKAAGYALLRREEEKKILIVLSDGRPYDVVINRPNAKNPHPYQGKYAISDTAEQIRCLRNAGVSVLGVFAGEEKDLEAEKKIFGKDFAYIRDISNFSGIVGRYLTKQLETNN